MNKQKGIKTKCAQFGNYTSFVIFLDELPIEVAHTKVAAVKILTKVTGATWRGYTSSKEAEKVLKRGPEVE